MAASIETALRDGRADRERAQAARRGIRLLPFTDPDYPPALRVAFDYPLYLAVRGRLQECDRTAVAIVGSRHATPYGLAQAHRFARDLARAGVTIVSGLARGVDTQAHRAALEAGRTIAVLGGGLARIYPPENEPLAERIAERGALVSEFGVLQPARPANFPRRNRIISALSLGTLLVEASLTSGALITCDWALDQGKTVFCLPGPVTSPLSRGPHALIRQGAVLVEEPADVLEELGLAPSRASLAPVERVILRALPGHVDSISRVTGLQRGVVERVLKELCGRGVVRVENNRFTKTDPGG